MASVQKTYALILGIVLAILGIWGFFLPSFEGAILGLFGVNMVQSVLHLIAGGFGIYVGMKGEGPGYNMILGWIGVVLGVLGFIPAIDDLLLQYLSINPAISILHIAVGIVSLGVYYGIKE